MLFDSVQLDWPRQQCSDDGFCVAQIERYRQTASILLVNLCGSYFSVDLTKSVTGLLEQWGQKPILFFVQHHRDQWRTILNRYRDAVLIGDRKTQERKNGLPAVSVPVVVVAGYPQNRLLYALFQLRALFYQDQIRALLVTDSCQGMAMGFEYMQETLPFENALKRLHSVFQSEIMVVGISSQIDGSRGTLEADIWVGPYPSGSISQHVRAQVFLKHDLEDIRSLYRTLMNYLEDS